MDNIIGRKVAEVRPMTVQEQTALGWCAPATVIVLDDGTKLFPSKDPEGNGPGALFGEDKQGSFVVGFRRG